MNTNTKIQKELVKRFGNYKIVDGKKQYDGSFAPVTSIGCVTDYVTKLITRNTRRTKKETVWDFMNYLFEYVGTGGWDGEFANRWQDMETASEKFLKKGKTK